jgi:hypothetical protein
MNISSVAIKIFSCRKKAFTVNTECLVRPGGCKTAEAILPGISQLESIVSPD